MTRSHDPITELTRNMSLPAIVAPMFIVSNPRMVVASCRAGLMGSFPAQNPRSLEELAKWLDEIEAGLAQAADESGHAPAPFAVNLVLHRNNPRTEADLELVCERRVPVVLTSKGAPGDVFARIHDYGGVVLHDVASRRHAEKALEAGADGLIAVAAGAGGHCGTINPFALMGEIRAITDKPVVLAGAISSGADIFAAQAMGADLAYMGTRFIASEEANAEDAYREMIVRARSTDVVFTRFDRAPANLLGESLAAAGFDLERLRDHPADKLPAEQKGAKLWKNVWSAGHGAGAVNEVLPIAELVERLKAEYEAARERAAALGR